MEFELYGITLEVLNIKQQITKSKYTSIGLDISLYDYYDYINIK